MGEKWLSHTPLFFVFCFFKKLFAKGNSLRWGVEVCIGAIRVNNLIVLTNFPKIYFYLQEYIVDSCFLSSRWIIPPTFTAAVLEVTFSKHYVFYFQKQALQISHSYATYLEGMQKPIKSVTYKE